VRPSEQTSGAAPLQVTWHVPAAPVHVTLQPASPLQVTVEPPPTVNAQVDEALQSMDAPVPVVSVQLAAPLHWNSRSTPATPVHVAPSVQVMFDSLPTSSAQVLVPLHVCTQLPTQSTVHAPAGQVHTDSFEHWHVSPVQITGTRAHMQPDHDTTTTSRARRMRAMVPRGAFSATAGAPVKAAPGGHPYGARP
jgi:hypothetical protein